MKRILCLLICFQSMLLYAQGLMYLWGDEFNTDGRPDPALWSYETGLIRNEEAQYYTDNRPENARVEDGNLIIETHKEDYRGSQYTSASLHTKNSNWILYGRIEVRAKIPTGRGMWPAIWTLGVNIDDVGWPECGEIDIMENVGFDPNRIHANPHTYSYNHSIGTAQGHSIVVDKPYDDFHVYAVEWREDRIDWYYDDRHYHTFVNEGTGTDAWPFDEDQYLILNAAVGGGWGGMQGIDDSIFPQQYLIDYVRVFELIDTGVESQGRMMPGQFNLLPNYPNPFNGETIIPFSIAESQPLYYQIFTVDGTLIHKGARQFWQAGSHEIKWNGRNSNGMHVPSGQYYIQLKGMSHQLTQKMTLIN